MSNSYTLTDLGPGVALDVSESGAVVGRNDSGERDAGGWYWSNGTRTVIKAHNADGLWFTAHTATRIRDTDGIVEGDLMFQSMDPSSMKRFIWAHGTDVLAIVGDGTAPLLTRVQNSSLFVGAINGRASAKERNPGGLTHDLNYAVTAPGWILVAANAINSKGQIVGGGVLNGQPRAFLLTPVANRVSAVESYAGFYIEGRKGHAVRVLAQDTMWGTAWQELERPVPDSDHFLWIDRTAPRRRNREYKVEPV